MSCIVVRVNYIKVRYLKSSTILQTIVSQTLSIVS